MKKFLFVLATGFLFHFQSDAKKIPGYYISKSLDKVKVTFEIPFGFLSEKVDYEKLQVKVKYYDSADKLHVLKPDSVKEISFFFEYQQIRMLSRPDHLGLNTSIFNNNTHLFLHLLVDGKLKLFKYYHSNSAPAGPPGPNGMIGGGGGTIKTEKYVLQKDNYGLFKIIGLSFRKDMMGYFSDCPVLAKKIEDRTYRKTDIEEIAEEYNTICK